jgi:tRNA threonylcarbamoyladenosine biosynthesis protein TsaE
MAGAPGPGTFAAMSMLGTHLETTVVATDAAATRRLGAALGRVAEAGDLIALWGDLGAGKTQLAKGFGAGLGVEDTVNSPSFILMAEYDGRLRMFHQDLYRLADAADVLGGGLIDDRQEIGVTLVEWPDRLGAALPRARLDIVISGSGDGPRTIAVRATDPRYRRYVEAAASGDDA